MIEMIKSWIKRVIIIYRLKDLGITIGSLKHKNSLDLLDNILPNCKIDRFFIYFKIDKIAYKIENYFELLGLTNLHVNVEDINIYNKINYKKEWKHKLPKEMIDTMYKESKIIKSITKDLTYQCKKLQYHNEHYIEEQKRLNEIFSKE